MENNQVGNYIHARYKNYLKYSITEDTLQPPPSVSVICYAQKASLQEEASRSFWLKNIVGMRESIEEKLNFFFNSKNKLNIQNELNEEQIRDIETAITLICEEKFNGKIDIDFETGKAASVKSLYFDVNQADKELLEEIKKTKKLKDSRFRSLKALQARYEKLMNLRDEIGRIGTKGYPKGKDLLKQLNNLEKIWEDFLKVAQSDIKNRGRTDLFQTGAGHTVMPYVSKFGAVSSTPRMGYKRLDHYLNDLISSVLISDASSITGAVGESVAKAGYYVTNINTLASTQDIYRYLKNNLPTISKKGVNKDNVSWYASFHFDEDFDILNKDKNKVKYINEDDFHAQVTQDKVDFTFPINGWDINNSIKNYDLHSSGKLLRLESGSDLLRFAQDYPIFTNHFLNIVGDRTKNKYENYTDEKPSSTDIKQMHDMMKLTAFLKAISGGVFTNKGTNTKADTFVVNDNSNLGNYKVYFISELLDVVANDISLITFSDYDKAEWPNIWFGDIEKNQKYQAALRISYLISTMRHMKLVIELKNKALQSIK